MRVGFRGHYFGEHAAKCAARPLYIHEFGQCGRDIVDCDLLAIHTGLDSGSEENHRDLGVVEVGREVGHFAGRVLTRHPVGFEEIHQVAAARWKEAIGCRATYRIGVYAELEKLYYDTANAVWKPTWNSTRSLVPISQIVFGTDYPYFFVDQVPELAKRGLSPKDLQAVYSGNAKKLLPRLAKVVA